jgi:transcriptional regulator with XRE-family HTH domain
MKNTTEAMHRHLGKAITELRRRMNWSQAELAQHIAWHGHDGSHPMEAPAIDLISKWEHGVKAPSRPYRVALARIAKGRKLTEELAPIFLAVGRLARGLTNRNVA